MKRWMCPLLMVAIFLGSSMIAQAAPITLTGTGEAQGDVYARFEDNGLYMENAAITDGSGEITLNDEMTLMIENASDEVLGVTGVAFPKTETALWDWIETCLPDDVEVQEILGLSFLDAKGDKCESQAANVSMEVSSESESRVVYGVDADGSVRELTVHVMNGQLTFTADGSDYYVVAIQEETPTTEAPATEEPSTEEGGSINTGDTAKPVIWIALFTTAIAMISLAIVKKHSE